jgi:Xaa-Pro aminopeptidase
MFDPQPRNWGYPARGRRSPLELRHGIGITHWAKPVISRMFSFENPEEIQEGWFSLSRLITYSGRGNDGARIEEMLVVTKEGYRILSKLPSERLMSCPCVGSLLP